MLTIHVMKRKKINRRLDETKDENDKENEMVEKKGGECGVKKPPPNSNNYHSNC